MKKSYDPIGNRTHDLPECSAVPQRSAGNLQNVNEGMSEVGFKPVGKGERSRREVGGKTSVYTV
jgi:hypothetical protein